MVLPWIWIQTWIRIQIGPKSWILIQIQCIWIHNHGGMSATDLCEAVDLRLHYAQGCWYAIVTGVGTCPHFLCVGIIQ